LGYILGHTIRNDILYSVTTYLTTYYALNPLLYTLSPNRRLQSLGLLGYLTYYTTCLLLNWEQLCATPEVLHCISNIIEQKSSSHSRSICHAILLAQISCTYTRVSKQHVNTIQNTKTTKKGS
jgi:hypothetical protein